LQQQQQHTSSRLHTSSMSESHGSLLTPHSPCPATTPPRSAFYVGYTITNLVGGYLASSLSAKQVLGWGVVLWSLFTITTPAAAGTSLTVLLANRAVMGAGEGVTFPCVQNIVKGWVPPDTRTRALTLIYSGGQLGTIVALITAPLIIKVGGCMCVARGWWCREGTVRACTAMLCF
jgi:MFS family permease